MPSALSRLHQACRSLVACKCLCRTTCVPQALKLRGPVPEECTPAVMAAVVKQHLDSPSIWAIFPIQDLMALSADYSRRPAAEETINDPTNPHHYWRFRMHVPLEDLLSDSKYVGDLQALLLGELCPPDLWVRLAARMSSSIIKSVLHGWVGTCVHLLSITKGFFLFFIFYLLCLDPHEKRLRGMPMVLARTKEPSHDSSA